MIYLSPPHMSGKELEYIKKAFESNYIAPVGEFIDKFEEMVKNYTGAKHALAVVNATSALHLALRVLGIKENDKVAVSTFTFIGGVSPILYQNAEPIFIDSDEYWQMDVNLLEEALKKERPKAVIVAHLYGQIGRIEDIAYLCKKYGAFLIEDAAEALGAYKYTMDNGKWRMDNGQLTMDNGEYANESEKSSSIVYKHAGTFGDIGIYSFNGNKLLTTSGGGMMISDNEEWIKKSKFLSTQAKEDFPWYEHETYGYNYRMSNILAAIGVGQMEVVEERIKRKREIFNLYKKELSDIAEFMPEINNSRGNRWLTTLLFNQKEPLKVMEYLFERKIESRPLWKPMHLQPLFKNAKSYINGRSEEYFKKGLCLPSGTAMSDEEVLKIAKLIKEN
ncbi:aminotransferase class V-fold PLP-dependent enzyme [Caminibacter pacificus]|uniref:Aminotransferase class V-fold PLP-dependent enzyme n=1 Tax=Caminibacter pacificus TaxID=1424653 RepID=A0AAJ4RBJ2_9BACT|nr:aminotransferase class V-fold PLP-dependent enzyme [Caminibacter pacificus]QCI29016.1 aminotransferase class V-fold PLP-dependent enzyme [Caminibacter pacificus]ROR39173.1 UDP-N-acetylbacillosamine transaminase [Caminibacter pacificus]